MRTAERRVAIATALLLYLALLAYQSLAGGIVQPCHDPLQGQGAGYSRGDVLANLVAYVPPGLLAAALVSGPRRIAALASAWLAIGAFSLSMELLQSCLSGRVSSWPDLTINSLGAFAGIAALQGVERVVLRATGGERARAWASSARSATGWATALFVGAWLATSTAPWRFTFDVGTIRANLAFLRRTSAALSFDPWLFAQHAFAWLAVGAALHSVVQGRRSPWRWLAMLLLASFGAQTLAAQPLLSWSETLGAASAVVAGLVLLPRANHRWLARLLPAFAVLSVAAYELAPVPGATRLAPFSWGPRLGLGGPVTALHSALFYGWLAAAMVLSLRWSTRIAGRAEPIRLRASRGIALPVSVVAALFAMEIAQCWIPGRVPDTSPPLFTALAFVVAWTVTDHLTGRARPTAHRPGV